MEAELDLVLHQKVVLDHGHEMVTARGGRADVARVSEGNSSLRHVLSLVLLAIHVR
jgi:hypothetical protein